MVFLLYFLLTTTATRADTACKTAQTNSGAIAAGRFYTVSLGCLVKVTPLKKPELVYREYYFDERGRFLVFDSVSGPIESSTGYKSYFLFPRLQEPNFTALENENISVQLASGTTIVISSKTSRVLEFPGFSFIESADVQLNSASFEIKSHPGIMLDAGWMIGNAAYRTMNATSVFSDAKGASCKVNNEEIFNYKDAIYGEPIFKFQTEARLAEFLSERCPDLDRTSLFQGYHN